MAIIKISAISRGQTKADDTLQIYEDILAMGDKKPSWFRVNYAIRVNKTVSELKVLFKKPVESNGITIGDENRYKVNFSALGLSINDQNLIRSQSQVSPIPQTVFDFDTVIIDKEK